MRRKVKWDLISGKFSEEIPNTTFAPLSPKTAAASKFHNPRHSHARLIDLAADEHCGSSATTQRSTDDSRGSSRVRRTHAIVQSQPHWQVCRSPPLTRATICRYVIASTNSGPGPNRAPLPGTSTPNGLQRAGGGINKRIGNFWRITSE